MMATCFKTNPKCIVFTAGFCFGALVAFFILSNNEKVKLDSSVLQKQYQIQPFDSVQSYNHWFRRNNLKRHKLKQQCSVDAFTNKNITRESQFLFKRVKVACIIFYQNDSLHQTYNTWIQSCNKYFFIGSSNDISSYVNSIVENHDVPIWKKFYDLLSKHSKKIENYDWLFFAIDSDMLVIMENLRHLLASLNPKEIYYLGRTTFEKGILLNEAEAGFVLSKAAVQKLRLIFESQHLSGYINEKIDVNLGKIFSDLHLPLLSTLDHNDCTRFHSETLEELFEKLLSKEVPCVSNLAVSFSLKGNLDHIYFYHYLVQRTKVVKKHELTCDTLPSNSITKDDYKWWLYENQDFLGVDPRNLSKKQFYDLWLKQVPLGDVGDSDPNGGFKQHANKSKIQDVRNSIT
nr:PREDICTED: uncharacterized protein LOC109031228 [Bemisia tabaci]